MGPADRESWMLTEMYPTGTARGWRRTGCIAMLAAPVVLCGIAALIAAVVALV